MRLDVDTPNPLNKPTDNAAFIAYCDHKLESYARKSDNNNTLPLEF